MKLSKPVVLGIGAAAVLVAAVLGWRLVLAHRALPEGLIQVNGRIEGDQVSVASKLAGRIAELKVREGDSVQAGQVLAVMDAAQIQAKVEQARAAVTVLPPAA
ncbi:biotin/lipoyl-binding protein, partial [Ideonella sp. B508-1]|uniref:biotin/lipoyl-binding protein n=1 Tax=Ideonella sp. B508-1 TaxID=137716 RepID=UPI0011D25F7C